MDVRRQKGTWTGLAHEHFGTARLGDVRRTRRLVKTAERIMSHPGGTLPQKMDNWGDLMGLYRLLDAEQVSRATVIAPHCQRTRAALERHPGTVLLIHDATGLDYTHVRALAGDLGQIGNGPGRGYICHNTLAVGERGDVLGLAGQVLHRRRRVAKGETPTQKRDHPDRESRLWLRGCEAVGPAPADRTWVDVCDRGGDTFEFLEYEQAHGRRYVIRSAKDRRLDGPDHVGDDRIHHTLHAYARDLPVLGERRLEVAPRAAGRPGGATAGAGGCGTGERGGGGGDDRTQRLRPRDLPGARAEPLGRPRDGDRPARPPGGGGGGGVEPLEWILLTNVPADTFAQACQRIDWYGCRPLIEDYHKGMKTGVGIELPQLEGTARLEPMIAILSVVAAALLELKHAARRPEARHAAATMAAGVPRLWVRVVSGRVYKRARDDLSLAEFLIGVARLGGFLARKNDGPPGWQTLWRGWARLHDMLQGVEVLKCV